MSALVSVNIGLPRRVGIRMKDPRMPALLASDAIEKLADGPERVSVAEIGCAALPSFSCA